uniref:Uncharacterized protein AlNc14C217G9031 n=1 Tax=Albugo laibachii Nc14 TaxID=890382 RepID=F0WRN3_9STRA|nr:conserved hypothetical protein [Albugo laibachii Nc14]|eukprot:CCA23997.1 conserved hypothetical protein [Albugo laibachii Nc14]
MQSLWESVQSRHWDSMASLEQAIMNSDNIPNQMLSKISPFAARNTCESLNTHKRFSNYSFSTSSILDHQGRRVKSTRRRFEDSNGRLKAIHEREIDVKKLQSSWERLNGEAKHNLVGSEGSPEEFESSWAKTLFGEAQLKLIEEEG